MFEKVKQYHSWVIISCGAEEPSKEMQAEARVELQKQIDLIIPKEHQNKIIWLKRYFHEYFIVTAENREILGAEIEEIGSTLEAEGWIMAWKYSPQTAPAAHERSQKKCLNLKKKT